MPQLSRRSFLQFLGATGLAPVLPMVPAPATAAVANASNLAATGGGAASASRALWASLYANSGSTAEFVGVARNLGLSNSAIQGVSARSIGVRVALAATTDKLAQVGAETLKSTPSPSPSLSPPSSPEPGLAKLRRKIQQTVDDVLEPDEGTSEQQGDAVVDSDHDEKVAKEVD